ncbi:cohesin subunit SA-1-like isoform X3 [Lytechinus variegatus]|uniref:cohesin subunit SA-1-like isoform X3 n=1 Tax=Lytechinus variegatus TaxID=7654 RepID=UPI001BB190E6|nr:cohesin subunit SA-1-like isoform X3 [Lytechinus variegatus]
MPGSAARGSNPSSNRNLITMPATRGIGDRSPAQESDFTNAESIHSDEGALHGRRGKKGKARARDDESEASAEPVTMFEIVRHGKSALQTVVDDWIESYKINREEALLDLINFFIHSSGCKGTVTAEMMTTMEHSDIIRRMTEEFDEETGDYPLIISGQFYKKFRSSFCDFVSVLVRQCQYSILYDQYMADNIISLLTGLSDSQVRAFRHTSTLAAMKLMTALVNVALNLSVSLDNTQRQHDAERAKQSSKRASEKIELLMAKRQEIMENTEEIQQMMNNIFKGIFVHRYRDTQPEIRGICMGEIGVWMKNYSEMFLSDSYLKYVGWTLHDKVGDVRNKCLVALYSLYGNIELVPKLELFTNRFKDRVVSMTLDKETDVAVNAIKVVTLILKYNEDILSAEDCENVYQLVYSSSRAVAQAAGEFLNERLFKREDQESGKVKRTKRRNINAPLIKDLVQFFIESELHEHAAYLVDSLWDINEMIRDWDCMTELLLEDPGRGEEALDERQETALIEIMVSAVRQSAQGHPPIGRGSAKKTLLTSKEKKVVQEDKMKLTEHFITKLPELLAKFNTDWDKVANLLEIPQHFEVEIYTTSRLDKHLDSLLLQMRDIVEKHTESEVLDACAKTYETLLGEQYSTTPRVQVAQSTLLDNLAERLKRSIDVYLMTQNPTEDDLYNISSSIRRIASFFSCHDLNRWELYDSIFSLVKRCSERGAAPDQIFTLAISCCHYAIMWTMTKLDNQNPEMSEMKRIRRHCSELIKTCSSLLIDGSEQIREEAFITICDLMVVFSRQLAAQPALAPLVYEANLTLQTLLSDFVQEHVFVEEDDDDDEEDGDDSHKIEVLHKRRNLLASFCKLIVFSIIEMRNASGIFKHYMKFYNDYGDIIKMTLAKSRENNKISCARTLGLSLTQLFKDMKGDMGYDEAKTQSQLNAIKELARRFSLTFGLDQIKTRDAVAALHKEGIQFSLTPLEDPTNEYAPPPNVGYLEILTEFSSKLMRQDKRTVLQYLDKNLKEGMTEQEGEEWAPLRIYRHSLLQGDLIERPPEIPRIHKMGKKQAKGMKRKMGLHGDESSNDQWLSRDAHMNVTGAAKRLRGDEETSLQGSDRDFEHPMHQEVDEEDDEEEDEEEEDEDDFHEGQAMQVLSSRYRSTPKEFPAHVHRHKPLAFESSGRATKGALKESFKGTFQGTAPTGGFRRSRRSRRVILPSYDEDQMMADLVEDYDSSEDFI